MKDNVLRPGYNEGIAVTNHIVTAYVVSDNAGDAVSFPELMDSVRANVPGIEAVVTDGAYGSEENLAYLERHGITSYAKYAQYHREKSPKWNEEQIRLSRFTHDEAADEYVCPQGGRLKFLRTKERPTRTNFIERYREYSAPGNACTNCALRLKCTPGRSGTLSVRPELERLRNITRENLNSPRGTELRRSRAHAVESVFGDRKSNRGNRRYSMRGLAGARIESGLTYLAHNIRRLAHELDLTAEGVAENREFRPGLPGG